jgi:hypothetical protein
MDEGIEFQENNSPNIFDSSNKMKRETQDEGGVADGSVPEVRTLASPLLCLIFRRLYDWTTLLNH